MAAGKSPITRHPLFPAVVALWFGALFGIGSLTIRPSLIESVVAALHIDSVITAAAPPLGTTARILIALTMAGIGGLLGAMLARRIGQPKPVARQRRRGAVLAERTGQADNRTPLFERPEASLAQSNRRSHLTSRHDPSVSSDHFDRAPVPGTAQILDVSQFGLEGFEPEVEQSAAPELDDHVESKPAAPDAMTQDANATLDHAPLENLAEPAELPRSDTEIAPADDAAEAAGRSFLDRTAASGHFTQPFSAKVSQVSWQDESRATPPTTSAHDSQGNDEPAQQGANTASAAERIASADLDELCPIELLERLAISLRQKRDRAAAAALAASCANAPQTLEPQGNTNPPADFAPEMAEDSEPENKEGEPLAATPFAPPVPVIPAALRPVGLFAEDDDDDVPSFVPPRHISLNSASDKQTTTGYAAELDEGYSSLQSLSRPQPDQRFVRVDEPEPLASEIEPVVVFPGQEPVGAGPFARPAAQSQPQPAASEVARADCADTDDRREMPSGGQSAPFAPPASATDPEETERALRAALANIQRMSGAA